jgi:hypothetical protein
MLKLHKFTVYAFDFENWGAADHKAMLEQHKHMMITAFHNGTTDIGEWDDDHELNKSDRPQLTFDKYFEA